VSTASYRTADRQEGLRFAGHLTNLGYSVDFGADPSRTGRFLVVATKTGGKAPDSSVLESYPHVKEA
jgi:hypothetical protein